MKMCLCRTFVPYPSCCHLPHVPFTSSQVLRYRKDQKYDAHWDYFFDQVNSVNGGNRYATVGAVFTD